MPRYDFKCQSCEFVEERSMRIAELDNEQICPKCGSSMSQTYENNRSYEFMTPESLGRVKAPGDFRNFLGAIKKAHPDGFIRDR